MKFQLDTAAWRYSAKEKEKLEKFGLKFRPPQSRKELSWKKDYDVLGEIEITTLEELMGFVKEWGDKIVLSSDQILIYDDYLE